MVGAGFAGLSAAVRLAAAGLPVTVVEATKHGGGRSRSFKYGDSDELDNGQHLLMGCYRETLAFLRAIGTADAIEFQRNLEVHMVRPGGHWASLRCPALPAPLHLAAGLMGMKGLGVIHKASAMRAGLLLRGEIERPDDNETCDAWLRRMGQTQGIRSVFWDPLIWSVLNDDPLVASAAMLVAVLERAFMSTRDASRLGVPRVPLSRLYVPQALEYLRDRGAVLRLGEPVRRFEVAHDRITGVTLRSGETIDGNAVVTSIPPHALMEALPPAVCRHPVFQDIGRLTSSPIINLWVFVDRPLFDEHPFVGLVGSPLHWLFDRTRIENRSGGDRLVNCTISAARSFVDDRPEVLIELFRTEMQRFFPHRNIRILDSKVVKEKRATISHAAGTYQRRPQTVSPVRGLYLAGDWVQTGLPATIESACQSGHDAAQAVTEARVLS